MAGYSTFIPYTGASTFILAALLIIIAVLFARFGAKMHSRIKLEAPGKIAGYLIILIYLVSIPTILVNSFVYGNTVLQQNPSFTPPPNPIAPFTTVFGAVTFAAILFLTRKDGIKALLNAVIGCTVALSIFELPYDIIIFNNVVPQLTPIPLMFNLLHYLPLLIFEIASFALLTMLPSVRISKDTFFSIAAMFGVFALWALLGFGPPADTGSYVLNITSKLLGFVAAITLFMHDDHYSARNAEPK